MNLQPKTDRITAQKEFLNTTDHTVAKVGGVTLDNARFTPDASGYLLAGSGVVIGDNGLGVPFTEGATGIPYVTQHDVKIAGNERTVVGALETGFLKRSVVTVAEPGRAPITDAFITASNGRFHLR